MRLRKIPAPQSTGAVALRLIATPASAWESTPPRLWSTTQREVAHACNVSERAVDKWWRSQAVPDEPNQLLLEQRFCIKAVWWRTAPPKDDAELFAIALMLGLALPDAEQRAALQAEYGIPIEAWDQPATPAA